MIYTVYKITNKINNKIYIGVHKTDDIYDKYYGSGKIIKAAIDKYGKDNFNKEILFIYKTLDEALDKEKDIVNKDFINRDDTYNISIGGGLGGKKLNGFTFEGRKHTDKAKAKIRESSIGRKLSQEAKNKISEHNRTNEERKIKISKALKGVPKSSKYKENHKKYMLEYYKNNPDKTGKGEKKKIIKCPYCDKKGSPNNMYRWHFNNCKYIGV